MKSWPSDGVEGGGGGGVEWELRKVERLGRGLPISAWWWVLRNEPISAWWWVLRNEERRGEMKKKEK